MRGDFASEFGSNHDVNQLWLPILSNQPQVIWRARRVVGADGEDAGGEDVRHQPDERDRLSHIASAWSTNAHLSSTETIGTSTIRYPHRRYHPCAILLTDSACSKV